MREILFKAKRLDNGEWVEGNIVDVPEDADFMPGAYILPRLVSARADPPTKGIMLGGFFEVDPSTMGWHSDMGKKWRVITHTEKESRAVSPTGCPSQTRRRRDSP